MLTIYEVHKVFENEGYEPLWESSENITKELNEIIYDKQDEEIRILQRERKMLMDKLISMGGYDKITFENGKMYFTKTEEC